MLSETELKIIAAFFPEGTERATKEIEKRSKYSHERVYSTLEALAKKGILSKKKIGKASVYNIFRFTDTIYLAFVYYSINKKDKFIKRHTSVWNALDEFIRKTKPTLAIVFGSYSKGEVREKSDVDVLCIGRKETEKTALSLRHKYNFNITPVIVKKEDFRNIKSENTELWEDLINFGIVLKGQEIFYELVYG